MADDDVGGRDPEGAVLQADAVAGGGLAGDGDLRLGEAESVDVDVAADGEDDGAAGGGGIGEAVGEGTGVGGAAGEIGDVVDVAAATAGGIGAVALGAGEGGDLGVNGRRRAEKTEDDQRTAQARDRGQGAGKQGHELRIRGGGNAANSVAQHTREAPFS